MDICTSIMQSTVNGLTCWSRGGRLVVCLATVMFASAATVHGQNGTWATPDGLWDDGGSWASGIAGGADNTADFTQVDVDAATNFTNNGFVRNGIGLNSNRTIGNMTFADANPGTLGGYEIYSNIVDDPNTPDVDERAVLTLAGTAPTITVAPFGPIDGATIDSNSTDFIDDVAVRAPLAGTSGFTKEGTGILTIDAPATALTGAINVNAGTLRFGSNGTYAGASAPIALADGTTLDSAGSFAYDTITTAANANVTVSYGGGSSFLDNIQGAGSGTLNIVSKVANSTISADGDWVTGGGWEVVNITGADEAGRSFLRARPNGGGFNANAFANSTVNLDNIEFYSRTNSFGNTIPFGALNGTATAELRGGHGGSGGSAVRYVIGGLNTNSEFAGVVDGRGGESDGPFGGMSIDKIGTGTHTFSGTFDTSLVGPNTDIGRQGGVIRVSAGTLAFTNTADSVPGGFGILKSTIDVLAGATLDVSGTTNTFSSSPLQQIQGSGTIVGPFNHDEGEIRPADVSTVDNDTSLTNVPVQTFGTINFNGTLSFNGGSIAYDMNTTPGGDDLINVIGTTNVSGGGVVDPNFVGGDPGVGGTYTLLTSSGGFDVGNGNLANWSVSWPGRGVTPQVFVDGNDLKFTTTAIGAGGDVTWSGAVNGTWDIESTQNWVLNGSPTTFFNSDDVTFNDTGANPTVTLAEAVAPRNVVVDSNTNNYNISGNSILATGSLTKRGSSTLTLSGVNTFTEVSIEGGTVDTTGANQTLGTGPATISGASIINIGNGGNLGISSLEVADGTSNTLQYTGSGGAGSRPYIPNLIGSGDLNVTISTNDSWINVGNLNNFSGTLTIAPDGTLATALGNARTAGAGGSMPNGSLVLSAVTIANQNGGSGEFTQAYGQLTGDSASVLSGFVGGSVPPNVNWQIGGLNTNSVFDGIIVNGGGSGGSVAVSRLTKIGTGDLELNGLSTYTGSTSVIDGSLTATQAFFADGAAVIVSSDGVLNLEHFSTDIIDALYFANSPLAAGTYGSTTSSATNKVSWITGDGVLSVTNTGAALGLPGDFNGDNVVDLGDYNIWRDNLGDSETLLAIGSGSGNALIDSADYDVWKGNFGATNPGALSQLSGANVPEPSTMLMLGTLVCGAFALRRRANLG